MFGLEGPLRASLRASLCLQGWALSDADEVARRVLSGAFLCLCVKRPGWEEGQSEFVVHGGTLIERTRCVRCGNGLPDGHRKFCGRLCADAHHSAIDRAKAVDEYARAKQWLH